MTIVKKYFSEEQKAIYLDALCFILNIDKKLNEKKLDHLKARAFEIGFDLRKLKTKCSLKAPELIKLISGIEDIRLKRYVVREMIMLAIADHELTDKDVDTIYHIGTQSGVSQDKIDDFFLWAARGVEWQIEGIKLVEEDL